MRNTKSNPPSGNESPMLRQLQYCGILIVVYVFLIFMLPASRVTMHLYHLSSLEYRFASFAVAVPSLIVWLAAFMGYGKLRQYAEAVHKTPEGIYFDRLAEGCAWLAWSLPLTTIIPTLLNSIANHHASFHPTAIIISNYLSLLLPLIALSIIASASSGLLNTLKVKVELSSARLLVGGFVVLGLLYCFFSFKRFDLSSITSTNNPYFLPIWLMILTVTIPYLYAWFTGILASYELTLYSQRVRGILYKRALNLVVGGLMMLILSSIALQYIGSVEPRIGHLAFNQRLVLTTIFRIIGGSAFILLALGASRLKKIEDV